MAVSFSTSRLAVASSSRDDGGRHPSGKRGAMEIRWRSPPERAQPFSPMLVFQLSGSFSAILHSLPVLLPQGTSSSVAPLRPRRMFSRIVLSNRVTS